jgi:hypothetical protein
MTWSVVDAVCIMPYGLELSCGTINFSYFYNEVYGSHKTSTNQVTSDIDYIARTIFAEVINVSPRIDNAFCVAQIIENRMDSGSYPSTAKGVVSQAGQFSSIGTQAFLWPSNHNYDPAFDGTDDCTQEELFMYCCYLAKTLYLGLTINSYYNNPAHQQFCPDIDNNRYNFYHVSTSDCPFYLYSGLSGQVTPNNVEQANYYLQNNITVDPIKVGQDSLQVHHVYYTY